MGVGTASKACRLSSPAWTQSVEVIALRSLRGSCLGDEDGQGRLGHGAPRLHEVMVEAVEDPQIGPEPLGQGACLLHVAIGVLAADEDHLLAREAERVVFE